MVCCYPLEYERSTCPSLLTFSYRGQWLSWLGLAVSSTFASKIDPEVITKLVWMFLLVALNVVAGELVLVWISLKH
jgi:hypothetical protein